jgi:putative ABC transport system ATP-binding protein/lipoprotein-releasing system ATP-binding protein
MSIVAKKVFKRFGTPPTTVLNDINLTIDEGEFIAITGRSGSGKSTLLYLLSSLDKPTQGTIEIEGQTITNMKANTLNKFRNEKLGFVFQFHYLIAELTAMENILLPAKKCGRDKEIIPYAKHLLNEVGLYGKEDRLPRHLSGGEQQRVAIARSLVMKPKYLFADEPTGALDSINGEMVMNTIRKVNSEDKTTIVLVTHDSGFASQARRQIHLVDGQIR